MLRAFMNAGFKSDGRTAVGLSGILPSAGAAWCVF